MSTEPKSPKPMPSADEINAYLELSAARTRLRLPLAKGNGVVVAAGAAAPSSVEKNATRALPVSAAKKLPTGRDQPSVGGSENSGKPTATDSPDAVWQPFSEKDER